MSRDAIEVRRPAEGDRDRLGALLHLSFNPPAAHRERMVRELRLDRFLCAYEGDRLVAAGRAHELRQWFGGRAIPMAGIASVATLPERRGTGAASAVMRELLRACRSEGNVIATLYPATVTVYRRLGFEYAGIHTEYRVPLRELPRSDGGPPVEELGRGDTDVIKECFRRFASEHNGPADSDEDLWWDRRVHHTLSEGTVTRLIGVRGGAGALDGYAAFELKGSPDEWGYRVACSHLIATNGRAAAALLGYFRRFASLGTDLSWTGPPNEPLALVLPEQSLRAHWQFRNMSRLLDLPGALESRGYKDVEGEATFEVDDPLFPENRGPWRIEAESGKVRVTPAEAPAAGAPFPIGGFTALFTGYVSPADLVRTGSIGEGAPGLEFLGRLFSGPPPWMPDFF